MYFFLLDPLPTLSAVIRGPTGRYVWTMQLRQFSRQKNVLHFMLFIQLILIWLHLQLIYTFDQWNQPCLRWQLKNWIFLLLFYLLFWIGFLILLTGRFDLWLLNFCLLQWLLTLSCANFYVLKLDDDFFVCVLKCLCSNIRTVNLFLKKCFSIVLFCKRMNVLFSKFPSFSLGPNWGAP